MLYCTAEVPAFSVLNSPPDALEVVLRFGLALRMNCKVKAGYWGYCG